jgi:predicted CopG family antitoxin
MGFEWVFKPGDFFTLVSALIVAFAFMYRRGGKEANDSTTLKLLSKELAEMKTEFKTFSETLQKIAVQETKIELLMKWYDELRHGDGFIQGPRRANVDGQYKRD